MAETAIDGAWASLYAGLSAQAALHGDHEIDLHADTNFAIVGWMLSTAQRSIVKGSLGTDVHENTETIQALNRYGSIRPLNETAPKRGRGDRWYS